MKKKAVFCAIIGILFFGVGIAIADGPNGAFRTPLYERIEGDPADQAGSGGRAGWVMFNTTCQTAAETQSFGNFLIVNIRLRNAVPRLPYDVYVKVNGAVNLVGQLRSNKWGRAHFHTKLDISDAIDEYVNTQAVVKPAKTTDITGYATATEAVPVKYCVPEYEGPMGAVGTELNERTTVDLKLPNQAGSGETVGRAIFNTSCCMEEVVDGPSHCLIVNIRLHDAAPKTRYDVWVKVNGGPNLVGQILTNRRGKASFHTVLDISSHGGEYIDVQAVVKPEGATEIIGYATATEAVPVKDCYVVDGPVQ